MSAAAGHGGDRLAAIVADVRRQLAARRRQVPPDVLEEEARQSLLRSPRRSLRAAIRDGRRRPRPHVIAEIKRGSPAAGDLGSGIDAAARARTYAAGGARAISVVTEPDHFHGDPGDLARIRPLGLPLLRKDFIIDRYQLLESIVLGADAVLLIARILSEEALATLLAEARELGLECLVEINDEEDAARAVRVGAELIGINNRDLRTFQVDPGRTARLLPLLPADATVVSASGMLRPEDALRAHREGADACLVGEALMRARDPAAWIRAVIATPEAGTSGAEAGARAGGLAP